MTWYFEVVDEGTKIPIIAENVPEDIRKEDHLEGLNSSLEKFEKYALREVTD